MSRSCGLKCTQTLPWPSVGYHESRRNGLHGLLDAPTLPIGSVTTRIAGAPSATRKSSRLNAGTISPPATMTIGTRRTMPSRSGINTEQARAPPLPFRARERCAARYGKAIRIRLGVWRARCHTGARQAADITLIDARRDTGLSKHDADLRIAAANTSSLLGSDCSFARVASSRSLNEFAATAGDMRSGSEKITSNANRSALQRGEAIDEVGDQCARPWPLTVGRAGSASSMSTIATGR